MKNWLFSREELIEIRRRATGIDVDDLSPMWVEAYRELALAADRLDAMIARTCVGAEQKEDAA